MLEFDATSAKTIILKWCISSNHMIHQQTDSTAVHSTEKMQAACNIFVDITISAWDVQKLYYEWWIISTVNVLEPWQNALSRLPSKTLNSTTKTEHWTTNQQCVVHCDHFISLLSSTSSACFCAILTEFSTTLSWQALLLDLAWYFNFRKIKMHQTHTDTHL